MSGYTRVVSDRHRCDSGERLLSPRVFRYFPRRAGHLTKVAGCLGTLASEGSYVEWPERESNPRHADFQFLAARNTRPVPTAQVLSLRHLGDRCVVPCSLQLSGVRSQVRTQVPSLEPPLERSTAGAYVNAWSSPLAPTSSRMVGRGCLSKILQLRPAETSGVRVPLQNST
jgi:hypothetical protein